MTNCNPSRTPVDTDSKLGPEGVPVKDPTLYRSLAENLLSWSSKRQQTISRSSAEAEYRGVANVVAETAWLRNLLRELHSSLSAATLVYCDNVSATYLSANPYADIFTNGLPSALFEDFCSSLSARLPPARTAGAYLSI
nr:ribonuclease H-like domain-containing protein [Tanacetum cinerariifolium]